jgi:hypothetical protein
MNAVTSYIVLFYFNLFIYLWFIYDTVRCSDYTNMAVNAGSSKSGDVRRLSSKGPAKLNKCE